MRVMSTNALLRNHVPMMVRMKPVEGIGKRRYQARAGTKKMWMATFTG